MIFWSVVRVVLDICKMPGRLLDISALNLLRTSTSFAMPSMPSQNKPSEKQTTILILEDERGLADLYTTWLTTEYTVRTTYTASEAQEAFDTEVDIALIDRRLPDGSGDEILRWVRQENPDCRTAMVTAVNPDFDIVDMPLDDYLVKPIEKSDLKDAVDSLNNQQAYDETVRELYALAKKKAQLESEKSRNELDSSDEYDRLQKEIAETQDTANESFSQLQEAGTETIIRETGCGDLS
jgi:DNA-binding response OmpR family regulator